MRRLRKLTEKLEECPDILPTLNSAGGREVLGMVTVVLSDGA